MLQMQCDGRSVLIEGLSVTGLLPIDADFVNHLQEFYSPSFGDSEHWLADQLIETLGGRVITASPIVDERVFGQDISKTNNRSDYFQWSENDIQFLEKKIDKLLLVKFNPYHGEHGHFASADEDSVKTPASADEVEMSDKWITQLSNGEKGVLGGYTGTEYQVINGLLRDSKTVILTPKIVEVTQERIKLLDSALEKASIDKDVTVYRGMSYALEDKMVEGSFFVDHGFVSTSLDKDVVVNYGNGMQMHIAVPAGFNAGVINGSSLSLYNHEHEVLLPRGTRFRIDKVIEAKQRGEIHKTIFASVVTDKVKKDDDRSDYFTWNEGDIELFDISNVELEKDFLDSPFSKGGSGSGNFGHTGRPGEVGGSGEGGVKTQSAPSGKMPFKSGTAMGVLYSALADGEMKNLNAVKAMLGSVGNPAGRIAALVKIGKDTGKWDVKINKYTGMIQMTLKDGPVVPKPVSNSTEVSTQLNAFKNEEEWAKSFRGKLSQTERDAVKSYTSFGYTDINQSLRKSDNRIDPDVASKIKALDSTLNKGAMPQDSIVYRNVAYAVKAKMEPGKVFVDHGFVSTSFSKNLLIGGDAKMHISVPKGHPAAVIDSGGLSTHTSEHEVLLPRGSFFHIDKIDGSNIYARVL